MIGLIKKDLLLIKSNIKLLGTILVFYILLTFENEMNISFLPAFLSVWLMFSTFSYDEYNKWDSYAITLPNGRKNTVRAKYLTTIILILITTFISILVTFLILMIQNKAIELITSVLISTLTITCIESFIYPFIFKFGIEKTRIILFGVLFVIGFIGGILIYQVNLNVPSLINFLAKYGRILFVILTIVILFLSYKISEKIYLKKEF